MSSQTRPEEIFRKIIEELRIRAKVREQTEEQTIHLVACWLRIIDHEDLAKRVEAKEWYSNELRDADWNHSP